MRKKRLIRLAAIIFCLYLIATTSRAIADLWGAGEKLTRRQERVAELQKEQEELKKRKARAESEGYIERIAREQLGMSKPGRR